MCIYRRRRRKTTKKNFRVFNLWVLGWFVFCFYMGFGLVLCFELISVRFFYFFSPTFFSGTVFFSVMFFF
ncbi:hypothetical protein Hanom_Chr16g01503111 [Helianthus anomalus]